MIINNLDTKFTIDTYSTFTSELCDDMIIEMYNEDNNTNLNYDDFTWDYDTKKIIQELAQKSIDIIQELDNDSLGVFNSIRIADTHQPKYYNYTTDSYDMSISYDSEKLNQYYLENIEAINKEVLEYTDSVDAEYIILTHYINSLYNDDEYFDSMYEELNNIYYANTTMKLI